METYQNSQFERRENPRINLETKISIRTSEMEPLILGWVQNISRGGFKLRADNPLTTKDVFRTGKEIFFETYEDFFRLKGKGEIIWASEKENEAGVRFDDLDQKGKHFLENFLRMF